MTSTSLIRAATRAALFGTTALVASAFGAQASDLLVSATETSTFVLGLGTADTLTFNGTGKINSVSPGVAVIDLADSITIGSTVAGAEIDADAVAIEVQGADADLTGGITIDLGGYITAVTTGAGILGTGILVHTGADISGGISNSGAIEGEAIGIYVADSASITGTVTNNGTIYGDGTAILVGDNGTGTNTMGAITNTATGIIGVNEADDDAGQNGIAVVGSNADITGQIANAGIIFGTGAAITVSNGGDISGGINNINMIGQGSINAGVTDITATTAISVAAGSSISGGIVNSGTILGTQVAIGLTASTLGSTANVGIVNQSAGIISGNDGIIIGVASSVYGISNSGQIFGSGIGAAIEVTDTSHIIGNITNNTGGLIGANVTGSVAGRNGILIANSSDLTGGINNTGTIVASDEAIQIAFGATLDGAITNNSGGVIGAYTSGATDVFATRGISFYVGGEVAGGIDNTGTIVGTDAGIYLGEDSSVGTAAVGSSAAIVGILNNVGGVIEGGSTGINIDRSTVLGGIFNAGAINGQASGVRLSALSGGSATTIVSSLTNAAGGVIAASTNGTAILIESGSQITGTLSNSGLIGAEAGGTGSASRGILVTGSNSDIAGGVNNSGTIQGSNAAIEVTIGGGISGGITNSGTIGDSADSVDGIHVNGGSVGSATGTGISNTGSGVIKGSSVGILVYNSGSILGGVSNASSAVISGDNYGLLVNSASVAGGVDNDGRIYGALVGLAVTGNTSTIAGVVDNSGKISGNATAIFVMGSNAALSSGILNSGTIYAPAVAIKVSGGGVINGISNSGLIGNDTGGSANTAILVTGAGSNISGTITNTGTIQALTVAINLSGNGSITGGIANGIGGTIQGGTGDAISIAAGSVVGSTTGAGISNATSGIIRGAQNGIDVAGAVEGGISNSGLITGLGDDGIIVTGAAASVTGGITNAASASILGNDNGIAIESGASVTGGISNSGLIEGDSQLGIIVNASSVAGDITNASGADIIGNNIAVGLVNSTLTGSLLNTGDILGGVAGIVLAATSTITGTITNNSGGIIYGDSVGIEVSSGSDVTGGIVNAGDIITKTSTTGGYGIYVSSGSSVGSITNSGKIQGGTSVGGYGVYVATNSSVGSITNSGTIEGDTRSVQFGNSDSTLILQTDSNLIGGADGGTGTNDTLVLEGNGSENEIFTNFEHLTVSASTSGTWVLSGNSSFDDLTVNSGTLDITGNVTTSTATVSGGILNISSGGTLSTDAVNVTGDLHIDGTLNVTSGVTVGGTLSGDATITGSGTLLVTGVLSPGNSPGTITTALALVQADDSTYLIEHEVGGTPETDITVVTNTATIGSNVDIDLVIGAGTDGFVDNILTATGGITGTYDDINGADNLAALVAYPDANTATLLVAKTDALAATAATVSDAGFVFLDNLQEGARRDGRVWATAYIYSAENEGLGNNGADFDQDAFGFNAGVDVISQPNLKVGLAVGYIEGEIDIDSATSDADNDGIFGAAYLNYMNDNFYLDGAIVIGQQTVDTTRKLTAGDATASIDATSYGANLEAGFELEALGGRLSPFVKVGIHSASLDAYSESGAAGAMTVGDVETQQMRVGGGFRYAVDLGSADGIQVTPAIKVGMTQEWQDGDSSADIGFVGYTGSTTAALDFQDQTTVDLGISFDVKLSQAVTAFVGWDAALGDETTRNTGTIGLSINW